VKADLLSIESHKIEAYDRETEVARQGRDLHERVGVDRLVRQVRGVEQKKIHCIGSAGRVSAQRPTRAVAMVDIRKGTRRSGRTIPPRAAGTNGIRPHPFKVMTGTCRIETRPYCGIVHDRDFGKVREILILG